MKCSKSERDYQPFPRTGRLASNMNLQLDALRGKVASGRGVVYCYVITTVENRGGCFVQTGSGPNFQGDLVTLCTCKHRMRTFLDAGDWKGKWIAGFSGVQTGRGRNFLVYLMQVSRAFESQYDFWFAGAVPADTKQAKAAHLDRFGDIYAPHSEKGNWFDPQDYVHPRADHVHAPHNYWHGDIYYVGCSGRPAALLAGDPQHSFLWDQPIAFYPSRLHRGQKKCELGTLLAQLKAGGAA